MFITARFPPFFCLPFSFWRRSLPAHALPPPVLAYLFTVRAAFRIKKQLKTC